MAYVTLTGNIGKTPELKHSSQGNPWTRFQLAWSERVKDASGQWSQGPTVWVQVKAFGLLAEHICQSLDKGARVVVSGEFQPESWSSDRGEETVMTLTADRVGASLDFQLVQVSKVQNNRGGGAGYGGNQGGYQGGNQGGSQGNWGNPSPTGGFGAGNGGGKGTSDEPPF